MKKPDKDLQQGQELRENEQQQNLQQTSTQNDQQLGRTEQQQEELSQQELDRKQTLKTGRELLSDLDEE